MTSDRWRIRPGARYGRAGSSEREETIVNRPAIAHRRVSAQPARHAHALQELVLLIVGVAALVAMLLTTSGSFRLFGA